jgi:hypothetical protein
MPSSNNNSHKPVFSHPSEAEFAQLLDYYQIAWQYEPTTFILEEDASGAPLEAFSPDFYLVDFDLYIELTTARQKLIGYKRRKIRRLQERYPTVNIKLLTRDDFIKMLDKYGLEGDEQSLVGQDALNGER